MSFLFVRRRGGGTQLIVDIPAAPGGLFNPSLDAGFFAVHTNAGRGR